MPNVFKVLPLAILLALGTGAGAATTTAAKQASPTKQATSSKQTEPTVSAKTAAAVKPATAPKSAAATKPPATANGATVSKSAGTAAQVSSGKSAKSPAPARSNATASASKPAGTAKATGRAAPTRTAASAKGGSTKKAERATAAKGSRGKGPTAIALVARTNAAGRPMQVTLRKAPTSRSAIAPAVYRPSYEPATATRLDGSVNVQSGAALVVDSTGQVVYSKNADEVLPIASITKLMTALVVLDAGLPLDEQITITEADKDYLRNSHSRLRVGSQLSRRELLHVALMSSENRAAAALGRTYPGGRAAFVQLMNAKARLLGMWSTRFADSTGLSGSNVSTARDLVKLAQAASRYSLIREFTTTAESEIESGTRSTPMLYKNSNRLVRGGNWDIQLSKTGYLNEAGRCLVMQAEVAGKPLVFVFLSGPGRQTPMGDANRIRAWLESGPHTG